MTQDRTFKLQQNVTLKQERHACFLISSFPLRAVKLDSCWIPFFQHLKSCSNKDVRLCDQDLPKSLTGQQVKRFLQQLVQKGFLLEQHKGRQEYLPKVSIIIPVRNRPKDLDNCLDSLQKTDYPRELVEVIVVDDGSDDDTHLMAEKYPVTLICNQRQRGASFSRNRGAEKAGADLLCFLDSDCTVDSQWLRRLTALFEDSRVTAAGGAVAAQLEHTRLDRYEKVCSSLHMGDHPCDSRNGNAFFYLPSCNFAVRKSSFTAVGGFKEEMTVGEDVDLCWRLMDKEGVISYTPDARVFHRHRNQVTAFAHRRYQYGTSEPLLQTIHADRVKTFPVYAMATLFWLLILSSALSFSFLGYCALFLFLGDTILQYRNTRKAGLVLSPLSIISARVRHNLSVLYHLSSFFSRYYLMAALLVQVVFPTPVVTGMILAHIGVGLVKYCVKKPKLDPLSFLFFFSLEQLSYQCGVWVACIKHGFFKPVAPKIVIQPLSVQP
ncbi:MAG: mycofactocin biosynthesis glycosyltransferase MftF [Desulfobacterium sp.]